MSITSTIRADWDNLSERAQEHIRRTRPALLNQWHLIEDGFHFATVEAGTLDEALELAESEADTSCYDTSQGTVYADICVRNAVTGEEGTITVTAEQDEPDCDHEDGHDWRAPHSVLGGLKENPGVWGHGGGVIIKEICANCGVYKITDTWAQRRDTGEQGLTETTYENADDASLAWIQDLRDEAMLEALTDIVEPTRHDAGQYYIPDYAPDSSDYEGGTEPGADWDEECDRRLAEVRETLPDGWTADWRDNDLYIEDGRQ